MLSIKAVVLAVFATLSLAGCIPVPMGPLPPLVVPDDELFRRYPNGHYVTPEGHAYHRDGDRWHYGRDHQEGLREEERRRPDEERGRK